MGVDALVQLWRVGWTPLQSRIGNKQWIIISTPENLEFRWLRNIFGLIMKIEFLCSRIYCALILIPFRITSLNKCRVSGMVSQAEQTACLLVKFVWVAQLRYAVV